MPADNIKSGTDTNVNIGSIKLNQFGVDVGSDLNQWTYTYKDGATKILHNHTGLGDNAIFYAIPIAVLALIVWWRDREARDTSGRRT